MNKGAIQLTESDARVIYDYCITDYQKENEFPTFAWYISCLSAKGYIIIK